MVPWLCQSKVIFYRARPVRASLDYGSFELARFAEAKENRSTRCSERACRVDEFLDKWADESLTQPKETSMLWTIFVILVVLWLLGFIGHFGGGLIHLLLVIAVVVLIIQLLQGRRGL